MDFIKDIGIHDFFFHNFCYIEEFLDLKKKSWNEVSNNFQNKLCLSNFYYDKKDSAARVAEKRNFLEVYAKFLKIHNAIVFRYYFEIIERVESQNETDFIVHEFYDSDMDLYSCFFKLNPNFNFSEELDSATKAWQENNLIKLTNRLEVLTQKLTKKLQDLPKLKKYNFDYLNLFDIFTIPKLISTLSNSYDDVVGFYEEYQQDSQNYGGGSAKASTGKKHKLLSVEEAIEKNFSNLIGFTKEKSKILNFAKFIKKSKVPVNTCFILTGNPGVGKTTLGKVLHSTLYDTGILKNDIFLAINGSDLKGKYVGWTGENVEKIFSSAKNGTLLIDEAYTLCGQYNDAFSSEALAKMMQQIDKLAEVQKKDLSDKSIVILAGYEKETDLMIAQNQGANRRFSNRIDLEDYTDEELFEIFKLRATLAGNEICDKDELLIKDLLGAYTQKKRQEKHFANAGLIVNILEQAMQYQAGRAELDDYNLLPEDVECAINSLGQFDKPEKMGF